MSTTNKHLGPCGSLEMHVIDHPFMYIAKGGIMRVNWTETGSNRQHGISGGSVSTDQFRLVVVEVHIYIIIYIYIQLPLTTATAYLPLTSTLDHLEAFLEMHVLHHLFMYICLFRRCLFGDVTS